MHKVVIVGGGFAGVQAARLLQKHEDISMSLVNPRSFLEYHGAMYRMALGASAEEVCLRYDDIFTDPERIHVRDVVMNIDTKNRKVLGESGCHLSYDTLILCPGSVPQYFNIPGVEQFSESFHSSASAAHLRRSLQRIFSDEEGMSINDIVIVGGGATGIELAGEIAERKKTSTSHRDVTIHIVEAQSRFFGKLPPRVHSYVHSYFEKVGIRIHLSETVKEERSSEVILSSGSIRNPLVIWTAGVRAHPLIAATGLPTDQRGRATVDTSLQVIGHPEIFVLGDAAATEKSGMAQTALYDGSFAATCILANLRKTGKPMYHPPEPIIAIPLGRRSAIACFRGTVVTGYLGWCIRRLADVIVFMKLLPFSAALRTFMCRNGKERD